MHDVVLIAVSSFHPKKTSQCLEVVILIVSLRPEQTIKFIITMNDLKIIQEKIYEIRGQRVMLDFDLAEAYGVETAQLKRQVRRNLERFEGDDFMFVVTRDELSRCQIGTLNRGRGQNIKYLPFAFTELGVAMLSSVLTSPVALNVNRGIMRAFVAIRRIAASLPQSDQTNDVAQLRKDFEELKRDVEDILANQNDINEDTRAQLDAISMALAELQVREPAKKERKPIGFIQPKDK